MMLKKSLQFLFLGFVIGCYLCISLGQKPTLAANFTNTQAIPQVTIAISNIRKITEAPGQIVYQVRHTLKDQHGNNWQTIAFKRIINNGETSFFLRLVGFSQVAEIDRSQPLTLTNSLGKILTATDSSNDIFTDSFDPEPNVGQYNLQPILSQLQAEIPLKLSLPMMGDEAVRLSVSPSFVKEWKTVGSYKS